MKVMNRDEKIANEYLEQLGLGSPIFEPNGRDTTPDFALCETAIEVTRLDQYLFPENANPISAEQIYITFLDMLREVIKDFDSQYNGKTYWIDIVYTAPFSPSKDTKNLIKRELRNFLNFRKIKLPYYLTVGGTRLHIYKDKPISGYTFKYGGSLLYDPKIFAQLYIDNIRRCIATKSNKINFYRNKYSKWQLLLVDSVLRWNLDNNDLKTIKASITDLGLFHSLIVISSTAELIIQI